MHLRSLLVLFATILMLTTNQASAGIILIRDLTESGLSVTSSDGAILDLPACGVTATEEFCNFEIVGPGADRSTFSFLRVNVFEPGGGTSDLLTIMNGFSNISFWKFTSDLEGGPSLVPYAVGPNTFDITEDGTAQPVIVISYFDIQGILIGTDTIKIQSDANVPEPSTWVVGLMGLILLKRKRDQ